MEFMVELDGVTKRFGSFAALSDFSLRVKPGEFLTLLGPSGCGKTTALRLIAGFENPDAGRVRLAGADVTALPPYQRDMNQVFQSYALFPHLSVEENIAFGLKVRKVPRAELRERVGAVIGMVALNGLESRMPHQLSGGEKQRVALARAVVCRPKVLLLDEPIAALDAKLRQAMQLELKRLQRQLGITFFFVTHDQHEALTISDRVAVMNAGRIEQLGTPVEVYQRPLTRFVADFMGQVNVFEFSNVSDGGETKRLKLQRGGAELVVPRSAIGARVGQGMVTLRPENVRLLTSAAAEWQNVFPGVVRERIFQGAFDRLSVALDNGLELTVAIRPSEDNGSVANIGEKVWCELAAESLVVIAGT
ncbi:MAG: ABC transporter ATP-binding protein [Verrucomicrobia bacterium]|nr:ABC transporter ATP-binding protein [Verrucomicrobiota bacterium]